MKWEILYKNKPRSLDSIIKILLKNRGIKDQNDFFNPKKPEDIPIELLRMDGKNIGKAIKRIIEAKKKKEFVIIYGDYDADGITATAILWEVLHELGLEVLPFIPDRFEDGYGIKPETVVKLKSRFPNLKLIITVDNGIVAYRGIKKARKLEIDTIIIDHHQKGPKKPDAYSTLHSTSVCGSALAWFFSRELFKSFEKTPSLSKKNSHSLTRSVLVNSLELAAIGTIADQIPLIGVNRSITKYGLEALNKTKRPGLLALFKESGLTGFDLVKNAIGVYEVGYIIAPRINATGRLKNGIESLRLLCTKNKTRASDLAASLSALNSKRQEILNEAFLLAKKSVAEHKVIVVAGKNYHEGVIGLVAGRLVEEFYRPVIVFSTIGSVSKASARSIPGFNMIEAIKEINLHLEGGGHPMAAGFSIETLKIDEFSMKINRFAEKILTSDILKKKLRIDLRLDFDKIDHNLLAKLKEFDPVGLGNPSATFAAEGVEIIEIKTVGKNSNHLKLKLRQKEQIFDSIYFNGGKIYSSLSLGTKIDLVFQIEENMWNFHTSLQLKIKDVRQI